MLNRSHIVLGKAESEWEEDDLMTLGRQHAIWVKMVDGAEIQGKIFVNISEVALRVKDYLNQLDDFLPLMQPEWIIYIKPKICPFRPRLNDKPLNLSFYPAFSSFCG